MRVICFGDSNTYGYDPRSYFGGRYPPECRWVDILSSMTGWIIQNKGMNGREIPVRPITVPTDTDLLIIMLGTNDLLQGASAAEASARMKAFLEKLETDRIKIILLAPPPMKTGEWVTDPGLIVASVQLSECYRQIAEERQIQFINAAKWNIPLAYDGVHFTEEGHRVFAKELFSEIRD